jgi:hypothetical protein
MTKTFEQDVPDAETAHKRMQEDQAAFVNHQLKLCLEDGKSRRVDLTYTFATDELDGGTPMVGQRLDVKELERTPCVLEFWVGGRHLTTYAVHKYAEQLAKQPKA